LSTTIALQHQTMLVAIPNLIHRAAESSYARKTSSIHATSHAPACAESPSQQPGPQAGASSTLWLENPIRVVVSVPEGVGVLYKPLFAARPLDIDLRF
jgi:hypothetical protein